MKRWMTGKKPMSETVGRLLKLLIFFPFDDEVA